MRESAPGSEADVFHALTQPAENILPEKDQHSNFLIPAGQHPAVKDRFLIFGGDQPLQRERRAYSLQWISDTGAAAEWMQDQGRDLCDFRSSAVRRS